jgi:homoaconitase/3-isopropylmalate dehydratase large subunit
MTWAVPSDARGTTLSAVTTTLVGIGAASVFHVPSKQKTSRFMTETSVLKLNGRCKQMVELWIGEGFMFTRIASIVSCY